MKTANATQMKLQSNTKRFWLQVKKEWQKADPISQAFLCYSSKSFSNAWRSTESTNIRRLAKEFDPTKAKSYYSILFFLPPHPFKYCDHASLREQFLNFCINKFSRKPKQHETH